MAPALSAQFGQQVAHELFFADDLIAIVGRMRMMDLDADISHARGQKPNQKFPLFLGEIDLRIRHNYVLLPAGTGT